MDRSSLLLLGLAIVFGLQCVIAARAFVAYQVVDGNAAGMVQIARRCVEENQCSSKGGEGRLGLFSGTSWIRLKAYSLRHGGDMAVVQSVVRAALILSAFVTFLIFWRYLGLRAAALALGLYLPLALPASDIRSLDNPNLFPLPAALYYASILCFIDVRRTAFSVLAALALTAATSAYILFIVLVPFHLALVALWARRPVSAVVVSCLCLVVGFCLDSLDAARGMVERVWSPALLPLGVMLVGFVLLLCFVAREIRRSGVLTAMPTAVRLRSVMTAAFLYGTFVIWLACGVFGIPTPPEARYFGPTIIPLLYLAAEATGALTTPAFVAFAGVEILSLILLPLAPESSTTGRLPLVIVVSLSAVAIAVSRITRLSVDRPARFPAVAVVLLCFGLGVSLLETFRGSPGRASAFVMTEGEPVVSSLYRAGYTYPQIAGSLHGPAADHLLPLLAAYDPQLFREPGYLTSQDFSLSLLKVPRTELRQTRGMVVALDAGSSRSAIVVREERPFLDWLHARVCRSTNDEDAGESGCQQFLLKQQLWHQWPYIQVGDPLKNPMGKRPYREEHDGQPTGQPSSAWSAEPQPNSRDGAADAPLRIIMPVHTPGRGIAHVVRFGGLSPDEVWKITQVTGVEFEGNLPGVEIRLLDNHASAGTVELTVGGVAREHPWNWLRHFIELSDENAHLLRSR